MKIKRGGLASACALTMLVMMAIAGCSGNTTTTQSKALYLATGMNLSNQANPANNQANAFILEYTPAQLTAGTAATAPHATLKSSVLGQPQGVVFDAAGDMWVIDGGTLAMGTPFGTAPPALYKFTAAQLAALGTTNNPMPTTTITSQVLGFPQQAVFDGNGNLFVSDFQNDQVVEFTASQLAMGGTNVTPNLTITSNPAFNGSLGITRDAAGDLFVANNGSTTIYKFNAAHIPASGSVTLTPDVILSDNGQNTIQAPWGLTMDSVGNLFQSNANAPFTVNKFTPMQLTTSGSPTPAFTFSPTMSGGNPTLNAPNGVCFDAVGDITVMDSATPFGAALFSSAQLGMTGGTVVPSVFIVGAATTMDAPAGCNFGPIH